MDIEKYVMEYSNIVPKDLSNEVMGSNLDFKISTYANKTGKVDNSDERVTWMSSGFVIHMSSMNLSRNVL